MVNYPIPMQVHVIWHPADDQICRPLAERMYLTLTRDPHQPLLPGIGIPVFFRCTGSDKNNADSIPLPISVPDTKLDLRIALVTGNFVMASGWMDYLIASNDEVNKRPGQAIQFSVDLSGGVIVDQRLAVRLDPASPQLSERLLQHVLLQCCRLLGRRNRGDAGIGRGAAPLKLFLSHTKRDKEGLKIANVVKKYLDKLAVDRFFDAVSIQPGDYLSTELESAIAESALVCIRTDNYVSSPWCRQELSFAKRTGRPMIVIDALINRERRSSPLLAYLPSVRLTAATVDQTQVEATVNIIVLEIVGFLYAKEQLALLKEAGLVPPDTVLMTRPPEARDVVPRLSERGSDKSKPSTFLYPDPMVPVEEARDFESLGIRLATPTSFWSEHLNGLQLSLSLSPGDTDELRALGLGFHVEDAMRVIARQLLAAGATLHYGGALFPGSLTEALFEMIGAYNRDGLKLPPLINHTPWPWDKEIDNNWLALRRGMLTMKKCKPPPDAADIDVTIDSSNVSRLLTTVEGRYALGCSLSQMRKEATAATSARVVLGGKAHDFAGFYPGILEEVLLSIEAGHAVYVLGGFGGAAQLVAKALAGNRPEELTRQWQERNSSGYREALAFYENRRIDHSDLQLTAIDYELAVDKLNEHGIAGLAARNGLDEEENRFLFETASVDGALYLVMKGLLMVQSKLT